MSRRTLASTSDATARSVPSVVRLPVEESDAALVAGVRAGRSESAAALFDRYAMHVQRVVARVMGPDPEIIDLVQDVFVAALASIDTIKDPSSVRSWLTQTAVFRARARIRRRKRWRFVRLLPVDDLPEVEANQADEEVSEALRRTYQVLDRLDTDDRIAFTLRFLHGMELTDVAAACSVSLATIKRRLSRAQSRFVELARQEPALVPWIDGGTRWTS